MSKWHYILINSVLWIQNLWQVWSHDNLDQLCSCLKSMTRGYAEDIHYVNAMIKKLPYWEKLLLRTCKAFIHSQYSKNRPLPFSLTSKKFRDNFKFHTFVSSSSFERILITLILFIIVRETWQLWNSGDNIKHISLNIYFKASPIAHLNDLKLSS